MDKIELPQEFPPGLAFKMGMSFVAHPMEVAKVLIQVDNELLTDILKFPHECA